MKHLVRAAGVLVVFIVAIFILPRLLSATATETLTSYGFYSARDNSQEWKQTPLKYADPIGCRNCHAEKYDTWNVSDHKTVSCEICHGPGETHTENGARLAVNNSNQLCLSCHDTVLARPHDFPQVDATVHGRQAACMSCHQPHSPLVPAIVHKVEGFDDCVLCHKKGGLKPLPASHDGRTSESCLNCHSSR
jgi:predicted CXXCH cytochrome family protein